MATCSAVRSGTVVGVYGVHTDEAYRRRGIGTAISTRAAVDAGARWGSPLPSVHRATSRIWSTTAMASRRVSDLGELPQSGDAPSATTRTLRRLRRGPFHDGYPGIGRRWHCPRRGAGRSPRLARGEPGEEDRSTIRTTKRSPDCSLDIGDPTARAGAEPSSSAITRRSANTLAGNPTRNQGRTRHRDVHGSSRSSPVTSLSRHQPQPSSAPAWSRPTVHDEHPPVGPRAGRRREVAELLSAGVTGDVIPSTVPFSGSMR